MKTLNFFPLANQETSQPLTVAILSGEMIHIIYPNGKVELITTENVQENRSQHHLKTCIVWGRVEDF